MFGLSYKYVPGADGRRYCFSIEPIYSCPIAAREDDDEQLVKVAAELNVSAKWLGRRLRHVTGRRRDGRRGKLTDYCDNCGSKMKRLGFRRWIEAPGKPDDTSTKIAKRLGGDGFVMVEGPWYSSTKKDAREWAYSRVDQTATA